jgi:hypothetical protein
MTVPFPQIATGDGIEVIEIDQAIRASVDHRERDGTAFHDPALADAFSGPCVGELRVDDRRSQSRTRLR